MALDLKTGLPWSKFKWSEWNLNQGPPYYKSSSLTTRWHRLPMWVWHVNPDLFPTHYYCIRFLTGITIPVNPQGTKIWRHLEIFRGTQQASEGRGIMPKIRPSVGVWGGGVSDHWQIVSPITLLYPLNIYLLHCYVWIFQSRKAQITTLHPILVSFTFLTSPK